MNYQVIKDEKELQKFIDWLPDGHKYYVSLFARKKFGATDGLKADKGQLGRKTATKDQLINKIRKLEVALGSYEVDGVKVEQDSLALYITPNPRNMHRAGLKLAQEIMQFVVDGKEIYNPEAMALNQIQVAGVKKYFDLDIDIKSGHVLYLDELRYWLSDKINPEAVRNIIETRGGYHVLVELDMIDDKYKKSWYNSMSTKDLRFEVTKNGDNMLPCPGCVQSDFIPKLHTL